MGRIGKEAMLEEEMGEDIPELMGDLDSHTWKCKEEHNSVTEPDLGPLAPNAAKLIY